MRRMQHDDEQTQRRLVGRVLKGRINFSEDFFSEAKYRSPLQDNPFSHSRIPADQLQRSNEPLR